MGGIAAVISGQFHAYHYLQKSIRNANISKINSNRIQHPTWFYSLLSTYKKSLLRCETTKRCYVSCLILIEKSRHNTISCGEANIHCCSEVSTRPACNVGCSISKKKARNLLHSKFTAMKQTFHQSQQDLSITSFILAS